MLVYIPAVILYCCYLKETSVKKKVSIFFFATKIMLFICKKSEECVNNQINNISPIMIKNINSVHYSISQETNTC